MRGRRTGRTGWTIALSACLLLPPGRAHETVIDGGHDLGDHADRIARALLSNLRM